ncbi:MAG TPA: magnesium/cobalt transporter CorA, partial [Paludibacter sp.]
KEVSTFKDSKNLSWLNVDGLDNVELMENLAKVYGIENNILSDVMNPSARPKVQEFEKGIFITIKMLQYNERKENLSVENLCLIATDNTLISFQEQPGTVFEPIRERIRKHKNKIRTSGSDYLAFALIDIVVDNYIYVIGLLGDKIESLEETMTNDPKKELLDGINSFKRELNFLRKYIKPAKEMIMNLAKMESEFIHPDNRIHFKELQDNIDEATDLSDSYREILYDQLNIYHTTMSTKLNDIMRVLTVYSVIFIPLTFLVGVYGTNFSYLPEKDWHYGYFVMWSVMIIITLIMLWLFKRKKWL